MRVRLPRGRVLLLAGAAVLVVAALIVPLPFYIEQPGPILELSEVVEVGSDDTSPVDGEFLLTAVLLERGTVGGLAQAWVDEYADLRPVAEILPPGTPPRAFFSDQREVFATTAELAAAIGLEAAGYDVDAQAYTGDGAEVLSVLEDSPAHGVLQPGDVVVAVDGEPIRTDVALIESIRGGSGPRRLTVRRDSETLEVTLTPRPLTAEVPQVGITISTLNPRIELPVDVDVDAGRLGGPSGGLMLALTVYDIVSVDVDLAGGRRIAGTGEIAPDGTVLPIGGIDGKVITADRAGSQLFLAPATQADTARAAVPSGSDLEVIGVTDFADAVDALGGPPVAV